MELKLFALLILPTLVSSCGPNYDAWYDGWCFKVVQYLNNNFYNEALDKCSDDSAALPTINSDEENMWLYNSASTVANSNSLSYWIALQCDGQNYIWPDGKIANYTNFDEDYVCDSKSETQHFYVSDDLKWHRALDTSYNVHNIVCKAPQRTSSPCDDFDILSSGKGSDICYKIQGDAKNWKSARSDCGGQNSDLSVIHDQSLNDFVRRTGVSYGWMDGMHIGLSVDDYGNYTWADGSSVDYQNYVSGFPNRAYGDCIAMQTGFLPGQWMNVDCSSTRLPYLCTRPAFIVSDPQPAGCPVDAQWGPGDHIYSPSYPQASGPISCDYILLESDPNKRVELDIQFFESNLCCDTLTVYDGLFGSTILKTFSGALGSNLQTVRANSNSMRLHWNATSGAHVRGFHVVMNSV